MINLQVRIIILFVIMISISACQKEDTSITQTPSSADQVTIRFAVRDYERAQYEQLAEQFHQIHPSLTVRVVSSDGITGGDWDTGLTELASVAETFKFWRAPTPEEVQKGLLRNLQPFVESDSNFASEDFYPGALDFLRDGEHLWGVPGSLRPLMLFFDKAAFSEAGLPLPQPGWSYHDLELAAKALTIRKEGNIARYGLVVMPSSGAATLTLGLALEKEESDVISSMISLTSASVLDATQWYVNLVQEDGVIPSTIQYETDPDRLDLIRESKAAMWIDYLGPSEIIGIYQELYDLGIAPLPGELALNEWMYSHPYMMSAGTTQPEASWQWLSFLSHQSLDDTGIVPPTRQSLAANSSFWKELDDAWVTTYRYILETPKNIMPLGLVEQLASAIDIIQEEQQSVESTLSTIQEQTNTLLLTGQQPVPDPVPTIRPANISENTIEYCTIADPATSYHTLANTFTKEHPETDVEILRPSDFSWENLSQNCDCFDYIIYGQLRMPKYRESLRNMQPFIDGERYLLDDHANELLSSYRWNNDLWSLPAYIDFLTVFYNKTIFDNAGIDYPQPHWTLTDFHDAATALTNQGEYGIIYGYMPFAGLDLDLNYFVEQKGGFLPYDSLEEMTFHSAIDQEKIADAVNWYSELFPIGETTSEIDISILLTEESNQSDRMQLIADNRVAMWTDYTSHTYGGMLEDLQIGVAPLPLDQGSLRWARPVGYMISAQSALPQQCWEWIKFLSSQPDAVQVAPVRYSQLDTRDEFDIHIGEFSVDEELKQEVISAYRFNIEHTDHILWRGNATLLSAFKAIITGTSIDLAVAEAIEKDTTYRTCLSKLQGDITPENSVACWQEIEAQ